jgi:hypothetical protein
MVGSGIRKKPIPDPGSRGKKDPGSGSATLVFKKVYLSDEATVWLLNVRF